MPAYSRTRTRGGFTNRQYFWNEYLHTGAYSGRGTYTTSDGSRETMTDIVAKPFVPGRTIINSHMSKTHIIKQRTPAHGSADLKHNPGYQGVMHAEGDRIINRTSELDALFSKLSNIDPSSLISQASTSALAGVKKPEVSGLVAIAEFRETVQSILHPVNGALNFLKRNALGYRKGKRASKRNLKMSASDIADQHLTIVFGLLPFISDVQGTLKVLRERIESLEPQRLTSRGNASSFDVVTSSGSYVSFNDGNTKETIFYDDEVKRTVTARAYLLYEADVSLADALGLSVEEVPRAIWQTATLSFVIDWFANVSQFIAALTPHPSIRIIASGYSVQTVDVKQSLYSDVWTRGSIGWAGQCTGGSHVDLVTTKVRVPSDLKDYVGLRFKQNMHKDLLDTFKITAAISLLTQRLQKFL